MTSPTMAINKQGTKVISGKLFVPNSIFVDAKTAIQNRILAEQQNRHLLI